MGQYLEHSAGLPGKGRSMRVQAAVTKEENPMLKFTKKMTKKAGTAPGTLMYVGEREAEPVPISVVEYDQQKIQEKDVDAIEAALGSVDTGLKTWINIDGIHDTHMIQAIGHHFDIHPLILEDIASPAQRPKAEDFEEYVYMVFKMLHYDPDQDEIRSEQISLILGEHYLVSFQETRGDVFDPVRERLRKGKGRIRKNGCGYLAYALIDAVVDNYFLILETIAEKIEALEVALTEDPDPESLHKIHAMKRELIFMRKQIWPMREMINSMVKGAFSQVDASTEIFFRDVYDHCIQVIDTIESYRDVLSGMLDLYLSTISNRMNEVMKVLTIIATIFIPLTFLAGIYGMNFDFMPELRWKGAYFVLWLIMIVIFIFMVIYFRKKKWL
jgi:magnesium transporter